MIRIPGGLGMALLLFIAASSCAVVERPQRPDRFSLEIAARAPFDFGCGAENLKMKALTLNTWGLIGCGKRATYTCICMSDELPVYCRNVRCSLDSIVPDREVRPSPSGNSKTDTL